MIGWSAAGDSHRGRIREKNEDFFHIDEDRGIFIVADGMGGHAAGEVASRLAADAALEALRRLEEPEPEALRAAFRTAQEQIAACCDDQPETQGMGTTLTAAHLSADGRLRIAHIGDSRLYRVQGATLHQLTRDHTWVQQEVDAGRLDPGDAPRHPFSHILSRVLTATDPPAPDIISTRVEPGDVLLLCSDGLYNMVDGQPLVDILTRDQEEPAALVERLIASANRRGGTDNITVIVVRITA